VIFTQPSSWFSGSNVKNFLIIGMIVARYHADGKNN